MYKIKFMSALSCSNGSYTQTYIQFDNYQYIDYR